MTGLLREYLAPHRGALVIITALMLIQAFTNLLLPSLNADIINQGVVTGDIGYIVRMGAVMLAVSLVLGLAAIIAVYFSARTAMQVGRSLRSDLYRRVESLSLGQVNQLGVPSLITRNTNDVQQVQMLIMVGLTMMVLAPVTAIGAIFMAIREDAQLSLLLLVVVPLMLIVIGGMVFRAIPLFRSMQDKIDRVNQVMRENLTGIRVIRAFNRTRTEELRFAAANDDLTLTSLKVTRLFALVFPLLMLIMNLSSVAVIWWGGHLVADGSMPIGNLTAFLAYIMQILFAVMMAVMTLMMVPRASASSDRIMEVLRTQPDLHDPTPADRQEITANPGLIELRDVTFRYPGAQQPVLADINLTFEPGQITAIVGGTGSGKTTLVNLLPRLTDATTGKVLVGGIDVRRQGQEDLWSRFGIVPQKAFLFSGTVASNMRLGAPKATDNDIWAALETAQAATFVRELPDGIESPIEQGGANFSGGQRQRLAIARALVRRPNIYIFDDSFSALDYATEAKVRSGLARTTGNATVIVVAQRISTIMDADSIVVLDYGRVVGVGTHDDLLITCETYRQIVESQVQVGAR